VHDDSAPKHGCSLCSFSSKAKDDLRKHESRVHGIRPELAAKEKKRGRAGDGAFPCHMIGCGYVAKRQSNLKAHLAAEHGNAPWLACTVDGCAFKTRYKSNLTTHARMHKVRALMAEMDRVQEEGEGEGEGGEGGDSDGED
jgi:hypothetical protein